MATPVDSSRALADSVLREALSQDPRRQALQRIVSSPCFRKAARLSSFLNYIVECALLDRTDEISEQQIGIHVFGRPTGYDPSGDNIVRGTARQLRQRLAVYYQEEGAADAIRITVPRGAYVPVFTHATEIDTPAEPVAIPRRGTRAWIRAVAGILIAIGSAGAWWATRPTPVERFWRVVFPPDRKTFLVPGDSGVVMFQNLTGKTVGLADYAAGSYRSNAISKEIGPSMLESLGSRRYTSFSDLKFATRLVQRREAIPSRLDVRYARDLRVEDLKQSNAVIVGAPQGNPWAGIFYRDLNFTISSDEPARTLTVMNRSPRAGEPASYTYSHYDPQQRAWGSIALVDNLDRSGKVLLVAGTTVAGLDAAADFLFNDSLMKPVLAEWVRHGEGTGKFELLVETSGVAANGSTVKLIAVRFP